MVALKSPNDAPEAPRIYRSRNAVVALKLRLQWRPTDAATIEAGTPWWH